MENDKKTGRGFLKYFNGGSYDGEVEDNSIKGMGIMTSPDGSVSFGKWKTNDAGLAVLVKKGKAQDGEDFRNSSQYS